MIDKDFVQKYKTTAELATGRPGDRMKRNAARIEIMARAGKEWQDVLLEIDTKPSAFSSIGLFETIAALDKDHRQRLQHSMQWMNTWDGISPVLIGSYAKAHFTGTATLIQHIMSFALPYKFDNLIKHSKASNFDMVISPDKMFVEIPSLGSKVYSRHANPAFENILSDAKLVKIFGGMVLASPQPLMWAIN